MTPKVKIKVEQIARMRVHGMKDEHICQQLGLSRGGLSRILALPEYKDAEDAVLQGAISKMDEAMAGKVGEMRDYFRTAVPAAMRAMVEAVTQKRDRRLQMDAAKEILDRDPDAVFVKRKPDQQSGALQDLPDKLMANTLAEGDQISVGLKTPIKGIQ